jgi:ankyrin repeat protein
MRKNILGGVVLVWLCGIFTAVSYASVNSDEFMQLCMKGTSLQVEAALRNGADVNASYNDGRTTLMMAAVNKDANMIAVLLRYGADINFRVGYGETALMRATLANEPDRIAALIGYGADVNIKDRAGRTALTHAIEAVSLLQASFDPGVVNMLIKHGADVNAIDNGGVTALMYAVKSSYSYPDAITALLKNGADINARDRETLSVLMHAARYNTNPDAIAMLIKNGAEVNAITKEGRSTETRLLKKNPELGAAMDKAGIEIDSDKGGVTALMLAARYNRNPDVINALLNNGANAKIKDHDGRMAIDYAEQNKNLKDTDALLRLKTLSN